MPILISPNRKGFDFSGKVGSLGDIPQPAVTTFTVEQGFEGEDGKFLEHMHKKLAKCEIMSEGITVGKNGDKHYTARVKSVGAGVPDFRNDAEKLRTFACGVYFEGVKLHSVSLREGKENLTFFKWVMGELKYSQRIVEFTMTGEDWEKVWLDFKRQEEHVKSVRARRR